jgi:heme/copper-type cytochrome/quinol oxidase subunit 1
VKDVGGIIESRMSRIAVWFYVVGGTGMVLSFFVDGVVSIPRRYSAWLPQWQGYSLVSIPFIALLGFGAGWLALEIVAGLGPAWRGTFQGLLAGSLGGSSQPAQPVPAVAAVQED